MAENGITGALADDIYQRIEAFANFGFAESHSTSFALLVYASSWFKLHYPAAFLAALLRAQPMGFYSPQTLTADARRHGVEVRRPDIQRSGVQAGLEPILLAEDGQTDETGLEECVHPPAPVPEVFDREAPDRTLEHRRDGQLAVRLGLAEVTSIGAKLAERIVAEREQNGHYLSMADLSRRVGLTTPQLEALATAGAFESLGLTKREALWEAGNASQERAEYLPGTFVSVQPPLLPMLSAEEQVVYDLWATGISPDDHPLAHAREDLRMRGVLSVTELAGAENGRRIEVAGVVTHRQRPATASGITFMNLEDETGILNIICSVGVWTRHRRVARDSPALIVRGILERSKEGVTNIVADRFEPLLLSAKTTSRDFR
jgi:error-prone DNA polymerase